MVKLPGKKKRFCEAYIRLNNATKAAAEAGYSAKSARTTGYRLLKEEAVAEYIRARLRTEIGSRTRTLRKRYPRNAAGERLQLTSINSELAYINIRENIVSEYDTAYI